MRAPSQTDEDKAQSGVVKSRKKLKSQSSILNSGQSSPSGNNNGDRENSRSQLNFRNVVSVTNQSRNTYQNDGRQQRSFQNE